MEGQAFGKVALREHLCRRSVSRVSRRTLREHCQVFIFSKESKVRLNSFQVLGMTPWLI